MENKWEEILSEQMKNYDVDTENSKEENTDSEKELINDIEPDLKKDENTVKQVLNQNNNNNKNNCNIIQIKNTINTDKVTNDLQNIDIKEKEKPKIIKFDGRDFIYYPRINKYNDKRKIKKVIYKCKNLRKDEKIRKETNQKNFCDATLEYIEPGQNAKAGYTLKKIIL